MSKITLHINGRALQVAGDITVAAALAQAGHSATRLSESGQPRAAFCGMGVCQECRVQIDGVNQRLACLTAVAEGMQIVSDAA